MILLLVLLSLLAFLGVVADAWRRAGRQSREPRKRWLVILSAAAAAGILGGVFLAFTVIEKSTGTYTGLPLPWMGVEWNISHTRRVDFFSPLSLIVLTWDFSLALFAAHLPVWMLLVREWLRRRRNG